MLVFSTDPAHSLAEFKAKYMMIVNVKGRFDELEGTVELKDPSTINVTNTVTIEIEGEDKPAAVADWITRLVFS